MAPHYRELIVWRRSVELAQLAYAIAERIRIVQAASGTPLPKMLRAATLAIPARLAAGHGSEQLERYIRAVDSAHGKVARAECLLLLAEELDFVDPDDPDVAKARALCVEIARLLATLHTSLRLRDEARPAE